MKKAWLLALLMVGCNTPPATTPTPAPEAKPEATIVDPTTPTPAPPDDEKPSKRRLYPLDTLEKAKMKTPAKAIDIWVMDDDSKREEGMMFLSDDEVKPEQGMLFAFPDETPRSFWMQNTLIPLDIVYIGSSGKVVSIAQGKREDESPLPSNGPAKYVLEVKQGEAAKLGLKPGATVSIPKTNPK